MKSLKNGLNISVLGLCLLLILSGMIFGVFGDLQHRSYLAAFLAATLLAGVSFFYYKKSGEKWKAKLGTQNTHAIDISMTAVCFLVSLIWVLWFRVEPREDYHTFWISAVELATGARLHLREYLALFPHILGYSAFLSCFLKPFGVSKLVPVIVNCFLSALTGHFIFTLIKRWFGTASAIFAFFLWIICPSRILYNTMVLSEPYYTCLLFCFFALVTAFNDTNQNSSIFRTVLIGLAGGVFLALVNTARPIGIIPILAVAIWLILLRTGKSKASENKKWILFVLALVICYKACGYVWQQFERDVLEEEPARLPGYSICVGFNMESRGNYSQEDMDQLTAFRYYEGGSAVSAQKAMLQIAKQRIAQEKSRIPLLMVYKLKSLLGNDEGGAYYAMEELGQTGYRAAAILSNIFYYCICCLAITGLLRLFRHRKDTAFFIPILYYIGLVLAQLLVEVSGRYHYSLIPVLVCLAAAAVNPANKSKTGNLE